MRREGDLIESFTVKCEGSADVVIEGEKGVGLLYLALGYAARQSFLKLGPVGVFENGRLLRVVHVRMP